MPGVRPHPQLTDDETVENADDALLMGPSMARLKREISALVPRIKAQAGNDWDLEKRLQAAKAKVKAASE